MEMKRCRQSYNHCDRRYLLGSRMNEDRSWRAREKHKMSLRLIKTIDSELCSRGYPELRRKESRFQFYIHPTKVINNFSEMMTLPIASWFQETLEMTPERMLGIDRQKLAILQCFLLKNCYYNALLCKHPLLWEKWIQGEGDEEGYKIGVELKDIIQKYEFG